MGENRKECCIFSHKERIKSYFPDDTSSQLVHSTVRTKYWTIDGLNSIKQLGWNCNNCLKISAKLSQYLLSIVRKTPCLNLD